MEIPVVHEISRSSKKPSPTPRSITKTMSSQAKETSISPRNSVVRQTSCDSQNAGSQPLPSTSKSTSQPSSSLSSTPNNRQKTARYPRGGAATPSTSVPATGAPSTKTTIRTTLTTTTKTTTNNFLKLAGRGSSGQKPKLPAKPPSFRENPPQSVAASSKPTTVAPASTPNTHAAAKRCFSSPATTETTTSTDVGEHESTDAILSSGKPQTQGHPKPLFSPRCSSPTAVKIEENKPLPLHSMLHHHPLTTSLHARLPSTDSGIQADGGFDSLSRYRGKSFLSDSGSTCDSVPSTCDLSKGCFLSPSSSTDTIINSSNFSDANGPTCGNGGGDDDNSHDKNDSGELSGVASTRDNKRKSESNSVSSTSLSKSKVKNSSADADKSLNKNTLLANTECSVRTADPSPLPLRVVKRSTATQRPVSSPPPVPVPASSGVTRRSNNRPPGTPQPLWRHSSFLPSKSEDIESACVTSPEPAPRAPNSSHSRGIKSKLFSPKTVKPLRSTSLENFSKIIAEGKSVLSKPSASRNINSRTSQSQDAGDKNNSAPKNASGASTISKAPRASNTSRAPLYMGVRPPPPPTPHATVSRTASSSPSPQRASVDGAAVKKTADIFHVPSNNVGNKGSDKIANTIDMKNKDGIAIETYPPSTAPRLHPSIKSFTSDGGVRVTFGKNATSRSSASSSLSSSTSSSSSPSPAPPVSFDPNSSLPSSSSFSSSPSTENPKSPSLFTNAHSHKESPNDTTSTRNDVSSTTKHKHGENKSIAATKGASFGGEREISSAPAPHGEQLHSEMKDKVYNHDAVTRPLRVVTSPGKLEMRKSLQPALLSPDLHDLMSTLTYTNPSNSSSNSGPTVTTANGRWVDEDDARTETSLASGSLSSCWQDQLDQTQSNSSRTQSPLEKQQPGQKHEGAQPRAMPRSGLLRADANKPSTKGANYNNPSGATADTSTTATTQAVAPVSSIHKQNGNSHCLAAQHLKSTKAQRMEIPVTHLGKGKAPETKMKNGEIPVTHFSKGKTPAVHSVSNSAISRSDDKTLLQHLNSLDQGYTRLSNTSNSRYPNTATFPSSSFPYASSSPPSSPSSPNSPTLSKLGTAKKDARSQLHHHSHNRHHLPDSTAAPTHGAKNKDGDTHNGKDEQKETVYENVRYNIHDGFRFDDASSRAKHADLMLKESDELIKEALEMLNNSTFPSCSSISSFMSSPLAQKFFSPPLSTRWRKDIIVPPSSPSSSEVRESKMASAKTSTTAAAKLSSTLSSSPPSCSKTERAEEKENFPRQLQNRIIGKSASGENKINIDGRGNSHLPGESKGIPIPVCHLTSESIYGCAKDRPWIVNHGGSVSRDVAATTPLPELATDQSDVSWGERKARMDTALSWLKLELANLRDMDNTLISQFKRCQNTIETLKTQRDVWEGLSEEGEEGDYWDDYEINEFNKKYLDSPGGSSSSQLSPGSRHNSIHDVTPASSPCTSPRERRGSIDQILTCSSGVTLNVEATL